MAREDLLVSVRATLDEAKVAESEREAHAIVQEAKRRGVDPQAEALAMARRRASGTPLAYVIGRVEFMGIELLAGEGALIPRPETELLARSAIDILAGIREVARGRELRVVDMCCGSGNLACSIASKCPDVRVWAADLTDGCVAMARRNVEHLGLEGRVTVHQGDLFEPLQDQIPGGTVDVVVCNPPYISTAKLGKDSSFLLAFEPREAFDGGPYGLAIHQRVIRDALAYLRDDAWLLFEMGLGQQRQLELLFRRSGGYGPSQWAYDDQQQPRVAMAQKKAGS